MTCSRGTQVGFERREAAARTRPLCTGWTLYQLSYQSAPTSIISWTKTVFLHVLLFAAYSHSWSQRGFWVRPLWAPIFDKTWLSAIYGVLQCPFCTLVQKWRGRKKVISKSGTCSQCPWCKCHLYIEGVRQTLSVKWHKDVRHGVNWYKLLLNVMSQHEARNVLNTHCRHVFLFLSKSCLPSSVWNEEVTHHLSTERHTLCNQSVMELTTGKFTANSTVLLGVLF